MYTLDLEKADEPEIKLPTSTESQKKQENFRKTSTSALLTMPKPLTVWITTTVENSERGERKSWLKMQHFQKTNLMASGPITSWQIDGETMETATDFIFLGSRITVDSDCSHETKGTCSVKEKLRQT